MNLFSDDPNFKRAQYHKLSDNTSEWQEEIGQMVDEALPESLGLDSVIKFQKVDQEKGYGVGSAVVRDPQTDKSIGIPLVVKAWHLAPLDLFFKDDETFPLNEDNLSQVFYHAGLGAGLAPKKLPPQLADDGSADMQPPVGGKYSYASVQEFVQGLSGTALEEDIKAFRVSVQGQPEVLAKIARSGLSDRFLKFAKAISVTASSDQDSDVDKLRAVKTLTIKKDGPNEYRLYANPDNLYDPVLISGDRGSLNQYLGMQEAKFDSRPSEIMNEVDKNGEKTCKVPESPWGKEVMLDHANTPKGSIVLGPQGSPFVFDPRGDDRGVENVSKFGRYGVRDSDGVLVKGFVIPNVVNFDGKKIGEKIFLGKGMASFQNRIAGIPLHDEESIQITGDAPETGRYGVLVYQDGGKAFSTVPFQVTNVSVHKGTRGLSVRDYKGNKMNLILSPSVDGIVPVSKSSTLAPLMGSGKNYMVSMKMSFVAMPKLAPVSESSEAFLKKASFESLDPNKLTISTANGQYIFRGNQLRKYAMASDLFDFDSLQRHEAEFLLCSWGLGQEKVAVALNGLQDRLCIEVHKLAWPPTGRPMLKTASTKLVNLLKALKPPMHELVKIASALEDADSVDSVLSLGFLNSENLSRFSGAKPMLKQTVGMLSKLLLAARLGLEDVNEDAIKSALTHIERVIGGLGKVKMMAESEEKTSSVSRKDAATRAFGAAL